MYLQGPPENGPHRVCTGYFRRGSRVSEGRQKSDTQNPVEQRRPKGLRDENSVNLFTTLRDNFQFRRAGGNKSCQGKPSVD